MGLLGLFFSAPLVFFILVPILLYSVIAHEVAHGWVASLFGDNTAKYSGRLSLNPLPHLDPMGTLAIFLVGFGWAKPVPVNYQNLSHSRRAIISVSLAGCLTNILIAVLAAFLLRLPVIQTNIAKNSTPLLGLVLLIAAKVNIVLGVLNLIPIPPLDGSRVLMEFLPYDLKYKLAKLEPYGFFVVIILLWTGALSPVLRLAQALIL
jgi:Zn-dependent protease